MSHANLIMFSAANLVLSIFLQNHFLNFVKVTHLTKSSSKNPMDLPIFYKVNHLCSLRVALGLPPSGVLKINAASEAIGGMA